LKSNTMPSNPHIARCTANADSGCSTECKRGGKKDRIPAVNSRVTITAVAHSHHSLRSMRRSRSLLAIRPSVREGWLFVLLDMRLFAVLGSAPASAMSRELVRLSASNGEAARPCLQTNRKLVNAVQKNYQVPGFHPWLCEAIGPMRRKWEGTDRP